MLSLQYNKTNKMTNVINLKVGDKIQHIRTGLIGIIENIGSPTIKYKVIDIGNSKMGLKIGDIQKTNIYSIGTLYELIED